jgi:ribosomal protein S18 acetylase RimI-like enzyme
MNISYTCDADSIRPFPADSVQTLDAERQIELFCAFFGVDMPAEDRAEFIDASKSGRMEEYGILESGRLVARVNIWNFPNGTCEIGAVRVLPEFRGRGFGKQLVSYCAQLLLARGIAPVCITTADDRAMRGVLNRSASTKARECPMIIRPGGLPCVV